MIVDVTLNQLRKLFVAGSNLLRYEKNDLIYLYYVSKSQVIFRTILERPDESMQYQLLINSLPPSIQVLNVIEEGAAESQTALILQEILMKLEEIKEEVSQVP